MADADFVTARHTDSLDSQIATQDGPSSQHVPTDSASDERLISRLIEAERSPAEIAREAGLTLKQFATWATAGNHIAILELIARLADIRAQLLLSQFRANAVVQLIQIATASEPSELARKACVDLLEAGLDPFKRDETKGEVAEHNPFASLDDEAILRALEQMAQQDTAR